MKHMYKIISLLLSTILLFSQSMYTYAATNNDNIQLALSKYTSIYPNSEINVVNGEIHIIISEEDSDNYTTHYNRAVVLPGDLPTYGSTGGSFYNFIAPSYHTSDMMMPYSKVYLPKQQSQALYYAKLNPGLLDSVSEQVQNEISTTDIIKNIQNVYGVTLSATGISFLASFALIASLTMIDRYSLVTAFSSSSKSRLVITKTIAYGVPATTYAAWDTNSYSLTPWEDYTPSWRSGVYYGYNWLN